MKYDIIVCGDSYSAALHNGNPRDGVRDHYSQLLQDIYGYKVLCLARGAMSNTGICFQMREAIRIGCRFLLYHKTWSSRINLVLNDSFYIGHGLKNFVYPFAIDESSYCKWVGHNAEHTLDKGVQHPNNNAPILSTVPQGLDHRDGALNLTENQLLAVKFYLAHLYNEGFQQEVDSWGFSYWHTAAEKAGIVPIDMKSAVGQPMFDYVNKGTIDDDNPYHTDRATQHMVAQNVHKHICSLTSL
jgi:hypothetical protein